MGRGNTTTHMEILLSYNVNPVIQVDTFRIFAVYVLPSLLN